MATMRVRALTLPTTKSTSAGEPFPPLQPPRRALPGRCPRVHFVGPDHVQAGLGVMFIMLHLVRQANGDEGISLVTGFGAQFVDGALGEQGGGQRVARR